jgi:signal transduction histidine kinase
LKRRNNGVKKEKRRNSEGEITVRKRTLHGTLIKNYVVFVIIMLAAAALSLFFLGLSLTAGMPAEDAPPLTAEQVAGPEYEQMDITDIALMGGWVEILDDDNRVIFVKGDKKTADYRYDSKRLYEMLSYPGGSTGWFCTASNFISKDGQDYTCLVLLPKKNIELQLNLINAPLPVTNKVLMMFLISLLIFLVLFMLNIFLYSKWTAAKISRPLSRITASIHGLRTGKLDTRMDFKAENEFLQIRDAFNEMAEKLEFAEIEKARLEEARNRMFIDISHDLKTPMTVISGYSRALAEDMVRDEDKKKRYIETICNKSVHVSNMIEDLFELAKPDFRETGLDMRNTDLAEFLRDMAAEHYEQMEDKGLELELHIPQDRVMHMLDRKEMTRAVSNILGNAIRHNPPGTSLFVGLYDMPGNIGIVIADNGTGIPEDIRQTIFDPFVKADRSRSGSGTGLGLAIAEKIVKKHGGTLVLDDGTGSLIRRLRQCAPISGSDRDADIGIDISKYRTFFIITFDKLSDYNQKHEHI